VSPQPREQEIARGPGPRWFRIALVVLAVAYYIGLRWHPPSTGALRPLAFFTEATALFPEADHVALEYRLEGWSCDAHAWQPLDPRPYFPIEADDKESRFQRIGYFYGDRAGGDTRRTVMNALDEFIIARHDDVDDGVPGRLGGIRVYKLARPLPSPGEDVPRYVFSPLTAPPADAKRTDLFYTRASIRKQRCKSSEPLPPEPEP
jgi:hypothetical protein